MLIGALQIFLRQVGRVVKVTQLLSPERTDLAWLQLQLLGLYMCAFSGIAFAGIAAVGIASSISLWP